MMQTSRSWRQCTREARKDREDIHPGPTHGWCERMPREATLDTQPRFLRKGTMTIQSLLNIVIPLVLVVFIGVRQVRWSPLAEGRLWRFPIIFGVLGVVSLAQGHVTSSISSLDVALLAVEVVISIAFGCVMGLITRVRPLAVVTDKARFESSAGWLGLVLWVVFIGLRVGFGLFAAHSGSALGASTGVILIMVAINRAARGAVMAARLNRLSAVAV